MNTLIFLAASSFTTQPIAPLYCPESLVAKGDVKGGPPLVHAFELTHRGTGTLTITRVEASCGCLRQSLSCGVLQPGEKATLTLEVNTLTQPIGHNRWQVTVGYKIETPGSPTQSGEVLLQITATVSREVVVNPPQLGFSTTGAASQTLTITDQRAKPLNVVKATTSNPHLTVEVAPRIATAAGGNSQTLTIKLAESMPAGHSDETVLMFTDDPLYPEFRVPVRVLKRLPCAVVATPETVAIRFSRDQNELSTLVQLRNAEGKPVTITSVESDHPGVTVKWSMGSGSVAVVRITVTEAAATQSGRCQVRVKLLEKTTDELVIPVAWIVMPKE
jgi:hypothetical protein